MRSSRGRVRAGSRRRSGFAAALIVVCVLAACGDNLDPPRITPARYMYDDGTEQIDRQQFYDRQLQTLCAPIVFSDGSTYCKPPTDEAFYADSQCSRALARVRTGDSPRTYSATTFQLATGSAPSRVYRTGASTSAPAQRYQRVDGFCFVFDAEAGYDWYEITEQVDVARLRVEPAEVIDRWQVERIRAEALSVPWQLRDTSYGPCDIVSKADSAVTWCHPDSAASIEYYADPACTTPIITADARPELAYVSDGYYDSSIFYKPGIALDADPVFDKSGTNCDQQSLPPTTLKFTVGEQLVLPTFERRAHGSGRLQAISLGSLPLDDTVLHDTTLDIDCRRERDRCVPATIAPIQTWFADTLCGQPVDVALVYGDPPMKYGRKENRQLPSGYEDEFYPVGARYGGQLYELDTGDTCSTYEPEVGWVAHSIGPALGEDAFARATLVVE